MWIEIGGVLSAAVALLLVVVSRRPDTFRFERSTIVSAPADAIFPLLNDFHLWAKWSPYEKKDPNMKRTYAGARSGVGSVYSWAGNKDVGEGRMTITDAQPNQRVSIQLEFLKPWKATNQAEFTLKPAAAGVAITWSMHGQPSLLCKFFSLFLNMDKMVGKDFESGLAELKRESEAAAPMAAVSSAS